MWGMLARKAAPGSVEEDAPHLPPAQRPGFLHSVSEHRYQHPEPRVTALDVAHLPGPRAAIIAWLALVAVRAVAPGPRACPAMVLSGGGAESFRDGWPLRNSGRVP